jgi:hypothetical protein
MAEGAALFRPTHRTEASDSINEVGRKSAAPSAIGAVPEIEPLPASDCAKRSRVVGGIAGAFPVFTRVRGDTEN